jgi:hypothetical protein
MASGSQILRPGENRGSFIIPITERSGVKFSPDADEIFSPYNKNKLITNGVLANNKCIREGLRSVL